MTVSARSVQVRSDHRRARPVRLPDRGRASCSTCPSDVDWPRGGLSAAPPRCGVARAERARRARGLRASRCVTADAPRPTGRCRGTPATLRAARTTCPAGMRSGPCSCTSLPARARWTEPAPDRYVVRGPDRRRARRHPHRGAVGARAAASRTLARDGVLRLLRGTAHGSDHEPTRFLVFWEDDLSFSTRERAASSDGSRTYRSGRSGDVSPRPRRRARGSAGSRTHPTTRTTSSPGRSRTYVASPDSKSGGPCRQTNRGMCAQA